MSKKVNPIILLPIILVVGVLVGGVWYWRMDMNPRPNTSDDIFTQAQTLDGSVSLSNSRLFLNTSSSAAHEILISSTTRIVNDNGVALGVSDLEQSSSVTVIGTWGLPAPGSDAPWGIDATHIVVHSDVVLSPMAVVSTTSITDTSGWRTYTNMIYGYKINYPSDWTMDNTYSDVPIEERSGGSYMGGDTTWQNYPFPTASDTDGGPGGDTTGEYLLYLIVHDADKEPGIDTVPSSSKEDNIINVQDFITASGIVGKQYVTVDEDSTIGVEQRWTFFKKGNDIFYFSGNVDATGTAIEDKMLSSFAFIPATSP